MATLDDDTAMLVAKNNVAGIETGRVTPNSHMTADEWRDWIVGTLIVLATPVVVCALIGFALFIILPLVGSE